MFDIGIGEILVLGIAGLLIFGPEKLPRAAADAAKWLKQIRSLAAKSRQDLVDSAGIDLSETVDTVKSLGDLHPRRLAQSLIEDDPEPAPGAKPASPSAPRSTSAPVFDPDAT